MSATLITGNLHDPIYAAQDADYQAGISGASTLIMPVGSQMALSIEDANTIKADDGVIITQEGRRIQIDNGAIEEWTIPTGTQGTTAYYIIGFHLYTDTDSAELCETFVQAMSSSTETITEDTFRDGNTEVYISVGRVVQDGVNLDSVTALLSTATTLEDIQTSLDAIDTLNGSTDISDIGDGTVTGAIDSLNDSLSQSAPVSVSASFQATSANTWEYTGVSVTLSAGDYLIIGEVTFSNSRPVALGINTTSDDNRYFDAVAMTTDNTIVKQVIQFVSITSSTTYYLWERRYTVPTGSNTCKLTYLKMPYC